MKTPKTKKDERHTEMPGKLGQIPPLHKSAKAIMSFIATLNWVEDNLKYALDQADMPDEDKKMHDLGMAEKSLHEALDHLACALADLTANATLSTKGDFLSAGKALAAAFT